MSATYSAKELIQIAFDKFYNNINFDNLELSESIKTQLAYLEENVSSLALSTRTTEAEAIRDDAYEDGYRYGYLEGRDKAYDEGFGDGYDEGHKDGYNDALEDSKE